MPPEHFDTRAFFMRDLDILRSSSPDFARDLERFAQRAEYAERSQAGVLVLEALVVFGQAGRGIDEPLWNALSALIATHVRKGEDEEAARLLVPTGALIIVDTLAPTAESARIVKEDIAVDSEAVAYSRGAAIVAALFRALSCHFEDNAATVETVSELGD